MRISDWSSDVCYSELGEGQVGQARRLGRRGRGQADPHRVDRALRGAAGQAELLIRAWAASACPICLAGAASAASFSQHRRIKSSRLKPLLPGRTPSPRARPSWPRRERKGVLRGKGMAVRVDLGGRRNSKKTKKK